MEDGVFSWVMLVIMFYGAVIYLCVKVLRAEREAKREDYWSRW